jgi:molecular chaperone GrpE
MSAEEERRTGERGAQTAADGALQSDSDSNAPSDEDSAQVVEGDLDALLADTKRERDEYLELAQRARADFENFRKRAAREAEDAERRGRSELAKSLIPSIDNLERALLSAGIDPAAQESADSPTEEVSAQQALARGVALVYRELREALRSAGIEAYDPAGERFDPTVHEAVSTTPSEQAESGTVLETVAKGYRLDGQVLRAARVVVSE